MSMQRQVDVGFASVQRDLFESGLAAEIGGNAFMVWLAIKSFADYQTGRGWPGMRKLAQLTGLATGTVLTCVHVLIRERLLRVEASGKGTGGKRGNTYVARERVQVRVGSRVLCTVVLDYVPASIHRNLRAIRDGLRDGKAEREVLSQCEIIPGDGFQWDEASGVLRSAIPSGELLEASAPQVQGIDSDKPLMKRLKEVRRKALARR